MALVAGSGSYAGRKIAGSRRLQPPPTRPLGRDRHGDIIALIAFLLVMVFVVATRN
jgi:hypothetical protein